MYVFFIAVSGPTEHCPIFHFPPSSVLRPPSSVRHRRDISTFLFILTVYTMKTIYFLNAYHLGWYSWPPGPPGPPGPPEPPEPPRPPGPPGQYGPQGPPRP